MTKGPVVIEHDNLSCAWSLAFNEIINAPSHEIVPLAVCVSGFDNNVVREDNRIRAFLDSELKARGKQSIRTVASTIFPSSLWNPSNPPDVLYNRYRRILPQLRKCRKNWYGVYFQRMIDFWAKDCPCAINQIEHVLNTREEGNSRRSAYQISILDPTRDHTDQPRRGFPCLQQVSISPYGQNELAVTGFYATQTLFERAYGNYVGLCELGRFFAHQWDLRLARVTCITSIAKLDIRVSEARPIGEHARELIRTVPEHYVTAENG